MNEYIKTKAGRKTWHLIGTWTRVPGRAITLCGRTAEGPTAAAFGHGRSCETCLRIARVRT